MIARVLGAVLALVLVATAVAAADVKDADPRLLDQIEALASRAHSEKLSGGELERLHKMIVQAEDQVIASWHGASLDDINASRTGKLWKQGNAAILGQMRSQAAAGTGTLGFMASGKSFEDAAFDPRSSDFDATVMGPRSAEGAAQFVKAAPGDFLDRRKFSVMSANGNFTRYRGSPETAFQTLTPEQMAAARKKAVAQMDAAAAVGGGYVARGSVAGIESKIAAGEYGGQVTFYSGAGHRMGEMPLSKFGSMAERFGIVENQLGDVLGMAADNHTQLMNYVVQKGMVAGSAKVLQRQGDVIARLPTELRNELLKDPEIAKALRDADQVSDAIKKGKSAAKAVSDLGLSSEAFSKRAQSISERVVQAAGKDFARVVGTGADDAARTGTRLMVEQNVLGAIVNAGGLDQFKAMHANNKALLAMADSVGKDYGTKVVSQLANRRVSAIQSGIETAARKAGIPAAELLAMLGGGTVSAKTAVTAARGMAGEIVAGMGIDAAIAAYQLSQGDREGAARSLVEGGIISAMPQVGLAVLAKEMTKLAMQLAIERATAPYKDSRLAKTWPDVMDAIANNQDKIVTSISGAFSPDDLMDEADQFLKGSSGYVVFPGLEKEVRAELARQLFAIRFQVRDAYLANEYFKKYVELKAWNEEWDRQQQEKLMAKLDQQLKRDEDAVRAQNAKATDASTSKQPPGVDKPTSPDKTPATKQRAWDSQPSTAPGQTPQQTQQSAPSIASKQITADQAAKQQQAAAEVARLDGMCKCFFETMYRNDCVVGLAEAKKQSKEWEARCEIEEQPRYDPEAKKCVGYFISYWRAHAYDDMKSYRSGYGYLKWPVIPTYCGTAR
jgi:hypothetical protein